MRNWRGLRGVNKQGAWCATARALVSVGVPLEGHWWVLVCHCKGTGECWCATGRALVSFGVPLEGHWWVLVCHWKGSGEFWCANGRALVRLQHTRRIWYAVGRKLVCGRQGENWFVVSRSKTGRYVVGQKLVNMLLVKNRWGPAWNLLPLPALPAN